MAHSDLVPSMVGKVVEVEVWKGRHNEEETRDLRVKVGTLSGYYYSKLSGETAIHFKDAPLISIGRSEHFSVKKVS